MSNKDELMYHHYIASQDSCTVLRSEEHTSELQSQSNLVCRLLLEKKKNILASNDYLYSQFKMHNFPAKLFSTLNVICLTVLAFSPHPTNILILVVLMLDVSGPTA